MGIRVLPRGAIAIAAVAFLLAGCTAIGQAPTPSATSSQSRNTDVSSLPVLSWWGGSSYYARFPDAAASGWASSSFFPIAVFLGKPSDAAALKAAGINTVPRKTRGDDIDAACGQLVGEFEDKARRQERLAQMGLE